MGDQIVGGRKYLDLFLIDADGRQTEMRIRDDAALTGTRAVRPCICTDCYAVTLDPAAHNVAHDGPACRVCGCTEDNACYPDKGPFAEACHWVEPDLCSNPACVEASAMVDHANEPQVVDLVAALRASVEAAKARRDGRTQ